MGFNIFTNPLEMHRYFEQQMNEFLKQFQIEDHSSFFGAAPEFPMLEEAPQGDGQNSRNLRDQYIKPGYEKSTESANRSRIDTDLDEKFNIGDLDRVLKKPERDAIVPFQQKPDMRIFGQSVQHKTVRNPDGSVEIHRIVRDSSGNQETTITKKFGDKEHTVIIKKDREGRQERIENFINMDSNDAGQFWGNQRVEERQNIPEIYGPQDGILSKILSGFFK